MKCLLIIAALSSAAAGQQQSVPLLTKLLSPTFFPGVPQLDHHDVENLNPPPSPLPLPVQQPEFNPSPQLLLPTAPEQRSLTSPHIAADSSKSPTSSPFLPSPTTIKFTLDDVSAFFQPHLAPQVSKKEGSQTRVLLNTPAKEVVEAEGDNAGSGSEDQPLWIVTSPGQVVVKTDTKQVTENTEKRARDIIQPVDGAFRPSLSFPFLTDATRPTTKVALAEERLVAAASNLQSQPLQFAEPDFNLFTLNPLKIEDSKSKVYRQDLKLDRPLSKTPVPQVVEFSEEKENSVEEETTNEAPSARRTLHFDEEFLTLIKSHNPKEREINETAPASSSGNLLWLSEGLREKAVPAGRPKTELPGAFLSTFRPSQVPKSELPGAFFSTFKPSKASKSELPDAFFLTPPPPQTPKTAKNSIGGVFTTSLRGLTSTTANRAQEPAGQPSEGLKVTPVGEVGEVLHEDEEGSEAAQDTPLSAAFKHGVQSLNVSAWVSGCPKLYGKVVLNCAVQHDAPAEAALTLRWKKKTFSDGRMEEEVLSEDNLVTLQDPRLSLERRGEHYNLAVKNFRAQDCGSYECEARAADTVAASQLLLFMCH